VHVRRVLDDAHVALGARDPELSDGRRAVGEQPYVLLIDLWERYLEVTP
jgi:hypothetical protein